MRHEKISRLVLLLSLGFAVTAAAQYHYIDHGDGTVTITRYTGSGGNIAIPRQINGREVWGIGPKAFANIPNLTGIVIPDTVCSLGEEAFAYCSNLVSATIPGSIGQVGDYLFRNCRKLSRVSLEDGITRIWWGAFWGCTSLRTIEIPYSVQSVSVFAFQGCSGLTSIDLPDSVTIIMPNAFENCTGLRSANLGNGVVEIANGAFANCSRLASIAIPRSVTNLAPDAFDDCTSLWGIYFRGDAPHLTFYSYYPFRNRATIYYLRGARGWGTRYAGRPTARYTFQYSVYRNSVTIAGYFGPGGKVIIPAVVKGRPVTRIGPNAFASTKITQIAIPNTVTSICEYAFAYCGLLTSIRIPDSVVTIGGGAFEDCDYWTGQYLTGLKQVVIGKGVTHMGGSVFDNCDLLTGVYFHGNAPRIDNTMFFDADDVFVYYRPWTRGWRSSFSRVPTQAVDAYEPDNFRSEASLIRSGQVQRRSIHAARDTDWAKFRIGSAGARQVRIETSGTRGDTQLWLYRGSRLIAYDDNSGAGRFSKITRASLPAGTYSIKVREYGNNVTIPAYRLKASWTQN